MNRELLFTVTKADFEWDTYRGSGKGGQHRNKTDSAVRCRHRASGAVGQAQEERSQLLNRQLAFKRCIDTSEFKAWLRKQAAVVSGAERAREDSINRKVAASMRPENLRVEVGDGETWRNEAEGERS